MRLCRRNDAVSHCQHCLQTLTRRHFFRTSGLGIGSIALANLVSEQALPKHPPATIDPLTPRSPHFAPRVKNIIYLFMCGGPSQVDLLDYKPKLDQWNGQPVPEELI